MEGDATCGSWDLYRHKAGFEYVETLEETLTYFCERKHTYICALNTLLYVCFYFSLLKSSLRITYYAFLILENTKLCYKKW